MDVTITDLAEWVGIGDSADDTLLTVCLDSATRWVRDHCHRSFEVQQPVATVRRFTATSATTVWIDDVVDSVNIVAVATDDDGDGVAERVWQAADWAALPLREWEQVPCDQLVALSSQFPAGHGRVHVTARWGWPATPDPVRVAVLEVAKDLLSARLLRHGTMLTETGPWAPRANRTVHMLLHHWVRHDRVGIA